MKPQSPTLQPTLWPIHTFANAAALSLDDTQTYTLWSESLLAQPGTVYNSSAGTEYGRILLHVIGEHAWTCEALVHRPKAWQHICRHPWCKSDTQLVRDDRQSAEHPGLGRFGSDIYLLLSPSGNLAQVFLCIFTWLINDYTPGIKLLLIANGPSGRERKEMRRAVCSGGRHKYVPYVKGSDDRFS